MHRHCLENEKEVGEAIKECGIGHNQEFYLSRWFIPKEAQLTMYRIFSEQELVTNKKVAGLIQQAAQSLVGKVDIFWEPTDNVIASAIPTLVSVTDAAKKPVICGEPNMVKNGGLATYGIDYYELGKQSGHMAADILEGKSKPANMPIQFAKVLKAMFNKTDAAKLGITLSDDLLKDADVVE